MRRVIIEEGGGLWFLALFAFGLVIVLTPFAKSTKSERALFYLPPRNIGLISLGYQDTVADSLWLRVIQDFDTCDHPVDRSKKEPCNNSWVYHMLDSITNLAPYLRIAYVDGGSDLDILLIDREGAEKIFNKGLKYFPHYWSLEYRAAYFYIFEKREPERAQQLLISAYKDGGPEWLPSLAGKIMTEAGKGEIALKVLNDLYESLEDGPAKTRIEMRINDIQLKLRHQLPINDSQ